MSDAFWPDCSKVGCGETAMWQCEKCLSWFCRDHHLGHSCVRPFVDDELFVYE